MTENGEKSTENQPILVFASFQPMAGKEEEVQKTLEEMIGPTRAEPGNVRYDLYEGQGQGGQPKSLHLFEQYTNQAALQAHRDSAHYKAYREKIAALLMAPITVQVLSIVDVA